MFRCEARKSKLSNKHNGPRRDSLSWNEGSQMEGKEKISKQWLEAIISKTYILQAHVVGWLYIKPKEDFVFKFKI